MNIAVYSGSFNPLHIGHLAVMRHLICKEGYDCVYLIVSPKNPLKEGISAASGQERFEAAVKAIDRHFGTGVSGSCKSETPAAKIKADDIELKMPEPHYTIRTLDALQEREPENSFTLVIGADNLAEIRYWKDYRRILTDYGVAVFPRIGTDIETVRQILEKESEAYRIRVLEAPLVNISSTEIREALAAGKDISPYLV